jgi:hypothetical protein
MSGSGASNLGYGNITPNSNINGKYVNVDNSNSPATFGSNEIPGLPGLAGAKNNIDAAKGYVPGICLFKGGAKHFKKKINKISRKYKMKGGKNTKRMKRRIKNTFFKRVMGLKSLMKTKKRRTSKKHHKKSHRRVLKGGNISYPPGYSQYQNNDPITPSYSVGGILNSSDLALANPPPIKVLSNCTNCVDNYNHYTGKGFPSRGH